MTALRAEVANYVADESCHRLCELRVQLKVGWGLSLQVHEIYAEARAETRKVEDGMACADFDVGALHSHHSCYSRYCTALYSI